VEDGIIAARTVEDGVVDGTSDSVEAEIVAVAEDKVSTAEAKENAMKADDAMEAGEGDKAEVS
jgi:hypothetical protein